MDKMEELMEEHDNLFIKKLNGEDVDFSRLREICIDLNEQNNMNFAVEGTNKDLWKSVNAFLRGTI